jgi:glucosylceramidase
MKMSAEKRAQLLKELFTRDGDGIGVSYLRLTIGSSDMNDRVFSYDDLYRGETDVTMAKFSLEPDRADVIPVMKEILAINPKIKILASPWSAPLWMKSSHRAQGGVLMPEFYEAYATYFMKYVEGMKAEGIDIDALTIQNEPLNEKNTPSMLMLGEEEDEFVKNNLGPAFKKAGIKTKIVLYDHNLDHPLYVLDILRDKAAAQYVDGSGWHLYGGTVDAMTKVHEEFPEKNIYFTEQSITDDRVMRPAGAQQERRGGPKTPGAVQAWAPGATAKPRGESGAPWVGGGVNLSGDVARVMIGVSRNWSRNILLWNLAADPKAEPHTDDGGCGGCWGALVLGGDKVNRLVAYYTLAQVSKFVPPGSVRIGSSMLEAVPNVAFRTLEGKTVLVVANDTASSQKFDVKTGGKMWSASLNSGAVGTYVW